MKPRDCRHLRSPGSWLESTSEAQPVRVLHVAERLEAVIHGKAIEIAPSGTGRAA
jgi:hypothetical protein